MQAQNYEETGLTSLISQKELEVLGLREQQMRVLEEALVSRDKELAESQSTIVSLREDFKYNLSLLEERDSELQKYDTTYAQLECSLAENDKLAKEARVSAADAQSQLKIERARIKELEHHHQQKSAELREALEAERWQHGESLLRQREDFESVKRTLQRQLEERDDELDSQRRDFTSTCEDQIRKLEEDWMQRVEDAKVGAAAAESRTHGVERELEVMRGKVTGISEMESAAREAKADAERELRSVKWELENTTRLNSARLSELQDSSELALRTCQADVEEKDARLRDLVLPCHHPSRPLVWHGCTWRHCWTSAFEMGSSAGFPAGRAASALSLSVPRCERPLTVCAAM
ncbi:hypothetical protein CYMTET_7107 [Cymbomonas tetramitiformis]|uniref:Uncharacterized protein n=1 Tax=Cymbomonas tetramitiformis TaxID=36881 RepID=A0AAE0GVV5_9CHLO|nr:hypothetical protein CYMTET_7107 [Cymbomonas tetramitiformis]